MSFATRLADHYDPPPAEPGPLARYHDDPVGFARDLIDWKDTQGLTAYQIEVLANLVEHKREAVRGPHGLGKTAIAALAVLWFALTRDEAEEDWKVVTTASAWMQLTHYLWPEVHKWAKRLRWSAIGRPRFNEYTEMLTLTIKLAHGEAFSASPSDHEKIEGAHADQLLYVYDEAKAIPAEVFDATEGAFAGAGPDKPEEAFALAISTPGEPQGRFYEIHKRQAGTEDWHVRHVTLDEAVAANRVSREWADQRGLQWGTGSALFANRVLGEFASSDEDGVIPLAWVEAAQQRWRERFADGFVAPGPVTAAGVDCSSSGGDRTVLARRYGDVVGPIERPRKSSDNEAGDEEMATAARIVVILDADKAAKAIVDAIGIGSGVVGRARELTDRRRVVAFVASEATKRKDRNGEFGFINLRAAAWWNLREMLDPGDGSVLCLPPDDELVGDLTAPHWSLQSGGRIKVESKDEIRKRLGRSTDTGDAVVQACWPGGGGPVSSATAAGMTLPSLRPAGR